MKLLIGPEHALFLMVLLFSSTFVPMEITFGLLIFVFLPVFIAFNRVDSSLSMADKSIISTGVGFSLIPLLVYISSMLGIRITFPVLAAVYALFFSYAAWMHRKLFKTLDVRFSKNVDLTKIALIIILLLGLITRVEPVKDIYAPPFADPAVESTIAKLIVDNGKIPETWQPFLDMDLNRQAGFPSVIAWLNILLGVSIPTLVLYVTNIVQALIPLGIYSLVLRLTKNNTQSLTAALIALLAAFPAFTFVAGFNPGVLVYLLIITALSLSLSVMDKKPPGGFLMLCTVFAGSMLVHPGFAPIFLVLFVPFLGYCRLAKKYPIKSDLVVLSALFVGITFSLPYFLHSIGDDYTSQLAADQWKLQAHYMNPESRLSPLIVFEPFFFLFNNLDQRWGYYLEKMPILDVLTNYKFGLVFVAIFISSMYTIIKNKSKMGYLAVSWFLIFILLSYVQGYLAVKFPFWQYIYPTKIKFLLVLPVAFMLSFAFSNLAGLRIRNSSDTLKIPLLFLLLLVTVPFGLDNIYANMKAIAQTTPMTGSELSVIEWIGSNTPENATILNFVTDMEPGSFIGDAGQWIPVIAGRKVVFPATTVTDFNSELENRKIIMDHVVKDDVDSEYFISLLKKYGVDYVFVSVRSMPSRNLFKKVNPEIFIPSDKYMQEYQSNREAFVFRVLYGY